MTILNQDSVAGYEWESVYTLLSITVGSEELHVQNKGSYTILVSFSADMPTNDAGVYVPVYEHFIVPTSAPNCWIKSTSPRGRSTVTFNNNSVSLDASVIPPDIYTSDTYNVRRIAVDSQQTSFEDNKQFRFTNFFSGVDNTDDTWGYLRLVWEERT